MNKKTIIFKKNPINITDLTPFKLSHVSIKNLDDLEQLPVATIKQDGLIWIENGVIGQKHEITVFPDAIPTVNIKNDLIFVSNYIKQIGDEARRKPVISPIQIFKPLGLDSIGGRVYTSSVEDTDFNILKTDFFVPHQILYTDNLEYVHILSREPVKIVLIPSRREHQHIAQERRDGMFISTFQFGDKGGYLVCKNS